MPARRKANARLNARKAQGDSQETDLIAENVRESAPTTTRNQPEAIPLLSEISTHSIDNISESLAKDKALVVTEGALVITKDDVLEVTEGASVMTKNNALAVDESASAMTKNNISAVVTESPLVVAEIPSVVAEVSVAEIPSVVAEIMSVAEIPSVSEIPSVMSEASLAEGVLVAEGLSVAESPSVVARSPSAPPKSPQVVPECPSVVPESPSVVAKSASVVAESAVAESASVVLKDASVVVAATMSEVVSGEPQILDKTPPNPVLDLQAPVGELEMESKENSDEKEEHTDSDDEEQRAKKRARETNDFETPEQSAAEEDGDMSQDDIFAAIAPRKKAHKRKRQNQSKRSMSTEEDSSPGCSNSACSSPFMPTTTCKKCKCAVCWSCVADIGLCPPCYEKVTQSELRRKKLWRKPDRLPQRGVGVSTSGTKVPPETPSTSPTSSSPTYSSPTSSLSDEKKISWKATSVLDVSSETDDEKILKSLASSKRKRSLDSFETATTKPKITLAKEGAPVSEGDPISDQGSNTNGKRSSSSKRSSKKPRTKRAKKANVKEVLLEPDSDEDEVVGQIDHYPDLCRTKGEYRDDATIHRDNLYDADFGLGTDCGRIGLQMEIKEREWNIVSLRHWHHFPRLTSPEWIQAEVDRVQDKHVRNGKENATTYLGREVTLRVEAADNEIDLEPHTRRMSRPIFKPALKEKRNQHVTAISGEELYAELDDLYVDVILEGRHKKITLYDASEVPVRIRRMYPVTALIKAQKTEFCSRLLSFAVIKMVVWTNNEGHSYACTQTDEPGSVYKYKIDAHIKHLILVFRAALFAQSDLKKGITPEYGTLDRAYPWSEPLGKKSKTMLYHCWRSINHGPDEEAQLIKAKRDQKRAELEKAALPTWRPNDSKTDYENGQECWKQLPLTLRRAFYTSTTRNALQTKKIPGDLFCGRLSPTFDALEAQSSAAFAWETVMPPTQKGALLFNDGCWVLVLKVHAVYVPFQHYESAVLRAYDAGALTRVEQQLVKDQLSTSVPNLCGFRASKHIMEAFPERLLPFSEEHYLLWYAGEFDHPQQYLHKSLHKAQYHLYTELTSSSTQEIDGILADIWVGADEETQNKKERKRRDVPKKRHVMRTNSNIERQIKEVIFRKTSAPQIETLAQPPPQEPGTKAKPAAKVMSASIAPEQKLPSIAPEQKNKSKNILSKHRFTPKIPYDTLQRVVITKPQPVATKPQPVATKPQQVATKPQPVAAKPHPVAANPQPVAAKPQPVAAKPQPVVANPQPVVAKPQPVPPKPPVAAKSHLVPAKQPIAADPAAAAKASQPVFDTLESRVVELQARVAEQSSMRSGDKSQQNTKAPLAPSTAKSNRDAQKPSFLRPTVPPDVHVTSKGAMRVEKSLPIAHRNENRMESDEDEGDGVSEYESDSGSEDSDAQIFSLCSQETETQTQLTTVDETQSTDDSRGHWESSTIGDSE